MMDPNVALARLRQLAEEVGEMNDDDPELTLAAHELSDLFRDLDEWLAKGGFLPVAWGRRDSEA